jgi:hypothetical protein
MELVKTNFKWMAPLLAAFLATALVGNVAFAQENGDSEDDSEVDHTGVVGEIVSLAVDENGQGQMTVLTAEGEEYVISLSADYDLKIPGQEAVTAVAGTFEVGAQVAVLAALTEDGSLDAVQVLVKPVAPIAPPVTGAVVRAEGGVLTIMRPDGTTKTVQLPAGVGAPALGDLVTTFASDGEEGEEDPARVTGLVRAEEVRNRLSGFIQDASGTEDEGEEEDLEEREQELADLIQLRDSYAAKHLEVLQGLLDRQDMPEAAKQGLMTAFENAQRGRETALQNAQAALERAQAAREGRGAPGGTPGGNDDEEEQENEVEVEVEEEEDDGGPPPDGSRHLRSGRQRPPSAGDPRR